MFHSLDQQPGIHAHLPDVVLIGGFHEGRGGAIPAAS